jgi:site-specific DNA-methyltransferase (adenine-specific)
MQINTIITGDSRNVLKGVPDGSVHLVATDPPYGIGRDYGNHFDDNMSPAAYLEYIGDVFRECRRVLRPDGSLFVIQGVKYGAETLMLLKEMRFHHRSSIIWHYTFGVCNTAAKNFTPSYANIYYLTKDEKRFVFNGDQIRVPSQRQLKYNDKRANSKG